jgi:hypothetical protein
MKPKCELKCGQQILNYFLKMDIYEYHNGCEILLPKKKKKKEKKRKAGLHINSL